MAEPQKTTETGIDVTNYSADKAAGLVSIIKPVKSSSNYVWMRTGYSLTMVNGIPTPVESAPELKNINRKSLDDFEAQIDKHIAEVSAVKNQLNAIRADMDALDAQ